jgi:hypothetical protein
MTAAEAKMEAAQLVLRAIQCRNLASEDPREGEDIPAIRAELRLIEQWLTRRACGGDKILIRQLERETGRQVKPGRKQAKVIERLAAQQKPPPRQE